VISIQALLTENELADDFVASFRARRLAERFFYWFPLSVRAWLALCSDGAYRNFVRSRSLIAQSARDLARSTQPGPLEVLSLGSGQGDKDLLLLEALRENGSRVSYVPVDASLALLEMACGGAQGAGFPALGIKADFSRAEHLATLAADAESPPRLILLVGNTLGAFDPIAEVRALRGLLRREDVLLNPLNRRFAWAPLAAVGIGEADGEIVFEDTADPRMPGLHPLSKHFLARRDVAALLGGESLALSAGERVAMNHSYKYDEVTFLRILEDAGLDVRWKARSDDQRFLMVLAGPA